MLDLPESAPEQPPNEPAALDAYDVAARYWAVDVAKRLGRRPGKPTPRSTKVGKQLLAAVRRDADEVMDALRLVTHGHGSRARFLRGEEVGADGRPFDLTLRTILGKADEYAEIYRAERDGPRPRDRGEHSSSRQPAPSVRELEAQDPHLWDPI